MSSTQTRTDADAAWARYRLAEQEYERLVAEGTNAQAERAGRRANAAKRAERRAQDMSNTTIEQTAVVPAAER